MTTQSNNLKNIFNNLSNGITLCESLDLSQNQLNDLYNRGIVCFKNNQLKDAKEIFSYLTFINISEKRNWNALGVSLLLLEEIHLSLQCYNLLNKIDPQDGVSNFFLGICYIRNNQPEMSREYFEKAVLYSPHFLYFQKAQDFLIHQKFPLLTNEELINALNLENFSKLEDHSHNWLEFFPFLLSIFLEGIQIFNFEKTLSEVIDYTLYYAKQKPQPEIEEDIIKNKISRLYI